MFLFYMLNIIYYIVFVYFLHLHLKVVDLLLVNTKGGFGFLRFKAVILVAWLTCTVRTVALYGHADPQCDIMLCPLQTTDGATCTRVKAYVIMLMLSEKD